MTRMTRPSCNSRDLNAETMVGLFVLSPELIPGIAAGALLLLVRWAAPPARTTTRPPVVQRTATGTRGSAPRETNSSRSCRQASRQVRGFGGTVTIVDELTGLLMKAKKGDERGACSLRPCHAGTGLATLCPPRRPRRRRRRASGDLPGRMASAPVFSRRRVREDLAVRDRPTKRRSSGPATAAVARTGRPRTEPGARAPAGDRAMRLTSCSPAWTWTAGLRSCSPKSSGCPTRRPRPSVDARSGPSGRGWRGREKSSWSTGRRATPRACTGVCGREGRSRLCQGNRAAP